MKLKEIILDLDGPLLEGSNRHYACYADFLLKKGLTPINKELYWQQKRLGIDRHVLLKQSQAEFLYDEFLKFWLDHIETPRYLALDELQSDVIEILEVWKNKGIKIYLITMRRNPEGLKQQLINKKVWQYFDGVLAVGIDLPIEDKAKAALSVIKNKEQAIWIGDTEVDILAARSLGIKVCAVSNGLRDPSFLEKLAPDYIESSLSAFFKKME